MLEEKTYKQKHWFWGPVLECKALYGQVLFASILINCFALASSLYIMTVYDRVIPNNAIGSLYALTIMIMVVVAFDLIFKILRGRFIDKAGLKIDDKISFSLCQKISRLDSLVGNESAGSMASTIRDFDLLKEAIGSASFSIIIDLPFICLFIFVIYLIGGPIAYVPAAIVPIVLLFSLILQPILRRMTEQSQAQGKSKQSVIIEMLAALETVKTVQGISMLRNKWMRSVQHQGKSSSSSKTVSQLASHIAQVGQQASQIGIVVFGVFLISDGLLTMGQLIACVILSGRVMSPLAQITGLLGRMNQAMSAYRGLSEILGRVTNDETRIDMVKRPNLEGTVSASNVSFAYPGTATQVLHDISFSLEAGERCAILGRIGCGKTTLFRLLCGLFPPDSGLVLIDNADIRQVRPEDVRKNVGVVLQNPTLFSGSVRDNMLMGKPNASDQELIASIKKVGGEKIISSLPGGFDFVLSEGGRELSSGMRQTLAVARALIGNPSILLMDEPTASLDSQSETALVKHLDVSTRGITSIFITHRGSMLQMADKVMLMNQGRIAMFGPRDEVISAIQKQASA